jgi:glycosyltransferase involved in cell wall biosynthesis
MPEDTNVRQLPLCDGTMARLSISIVLATCESADVLDLNLHALSEQDDEFEVIVADDGSGAEVARVVEHWRRRIDLQHVWQPNEGFRKARALDLAALSAHGDYLLFLDSDCLPRKRFVRTVRRGAVPGWFLSTKRIDLDEVLSRRIVEHRTPVWRWSAATWLVRAPRQVRRPGYLVALRDRRRPWRPASLDFVPPWFAYCLIGVFRKDFERVNGYDMRCRRSDDGEDQDLAIRLRRCGLRCSWAGPETTVLHMWHPPRADRTGDHFPVFRETEASARVEAVQGLRELASELEDHSSAKRVWASSASSEPEKR